MKKYLLSFLVIMSLLMMCVVALPTEVLAATADVTYLDEYGVEQPLVTATVIEAGTAALTDDLTDGWYVVNSDVIRTETITVSGNVKLILADGGKLTVTGSNDNAGINVTGTNKLTIYGQTDGTGVLNATGGSSGAGIGCGLNSSGGTITIIGGTVNTMGGDGDEGDDESMMIGALGGAGIGGDGADITISGGTVNATGGKYAAGISGGNVSSGGNIAISGGTVNATGGELAAGIGARIFRDGGNITISKGIVNAKGGNAGAGIGGGFLGDDGHNITISGGTVNASGGELAAGIGGGHVGGGTGGNIIISGGTVIASGGGAGIGSGCENYGLVGDITIVGGTVKATGGDGSAGIGGGVCSRHSGVITISGGTVEAVGGDGDIGGAGIGGGHEGSGGMDITISGGMVNASGGSNSAGIGGGYKMTLYNYETESYDYGNITIIGGTVNATGGASGAGIGGGMEGSGVKIAINGGVIFAQGRNGAKDVGAGTDSTSDGSLAISGNAALFLRNDSSVELTTTTHTHRAFTGHTAGDAIAGYGIPVPWAGDFGAWLTEKWISVSKLPTKIHYIKGESLDVSGGEIRVNNSLTLAMSKTNVGAFDSNSTTYGPQTITVEYGGATTSFKVYLNIFKDVPYGHDFYSTIRNIVSEGVMRGKGDGRYFGPADKLTRAEASVALVRAAGLEPARGSAFSDVPLDHWANAYINAAAKAGIVNGKGPGRFAPNDNITRAELAVMVSRAFKLKKDSSNVKNFSDVPSNHWAYNFINNLTSNGIVGGYQDGRFGPEDPVTRGQFTAFVWKSMNKK